MVGLLQSDVQDAYQAQFCGGSLVHPYWVVSAAHCVIDTWPEEVDVLIGTDNLNQTSGALRIPVAEIVLHPNYNPYTDESDLALLRLAIPVTNRAVIPLIDHPDLDAEGVWSKVIGWGATNGVGTAFTADLMEVAIPIANFAVANAPASYNGALTTNMLPAGLAEGGIDSCKGDSGGPLMVPSPFPPGWMLAGIVSFGLPLPCAAPGNYGIYTRVLNYRHFILNHISPYYGAFERSNQIVGPWRDDDGDGIPNLVEFAFRSNPLQPSAEDMPSIDLRTVSGEREPFVRFRKPVLAEDITYGIEFAPRLTHSSPWTPYDLSAAFLGAEPVPGDAEAEEWKIAAPPFFDPNQGAFRVTVSPSANLVLSPRELMYPGALLGSLTPQDRIHPTRPGRYMKEYDMLNLPFGSAVTITLRSVQFDAWLEILNADSGAILLVASSNTGGGLDEKIEFTPAAGTRYRARVSSTDAGEIGTFEVALFRIPELLPTIGFPDTQHGALTLADPLDPNFLPGAQYYKNDYLLNAPDEAAIIVRMNSTQLDPYLFVINAENGKTVAEDDDSDGGFNARVHFTTQPGVRYIIRATSAFQLETGSYTLMTQVRPPSPF